MSSFAKRKARVIKVDDDDDVPLGSSAITTDQQSVSEGAPAPKFTRKPLRQSGLRKSINVNQVDDADGASTTPGKAATAHNDDDDDDGPVVIRPTIGRAGSTKQKKRASTSRLSFGPGQGAGDAAFSTPKKSSLGQQAAENSAIKKPGFTHRLPMRRFNDDEEDRPRYSKEFLDELQSSTPNTPQPISSLRGTSDDEMELDPSELEGALIVNESTYSEAPVPQQTNILSNTEIQERKQRRARLAREEDFISLDDEGDDRTDGKVSENTRLVPEDEDLGEGFDDFVEDGGLSLGKKAEREEKARRRREMAEQIQMAEGNSEESSDESDAERRAAFEAAQTRSGMDGLSKPEKRDPAEALLQVPAKITPLPELDGCLEKLSLSLRGMEGALREKQTALDRLKAEREAILAREGEVQALLDEAGKRYTSILGGSGSTLEAGQSPARQIQNPGMSELAVERGLESFGTTPVRRPDVGDE
ncbi:hypothetical protein HYQ45_002502 [Verticillium longisporum]|uniref:Nineteen complex-related protein 2-domain-containing protein n=2 Tax=Verticillium TaxID=1036719 RepID=A0A8I3AVD7_VERLO|nr:putative transcriptional regulatory protein C1F7.11c [Verticillium dahliae VDG2]KAG7140785.1 hypothetical protein HYQ45_002502 [Verticillium longisporum]KAH6697984.1 nineteen complex-related protein 2-domain-containing protein [Verticillium dahliae]PNH28020.1 hypothetical protein BJF96_g8671 [Verticillium dahliae]PNH54466.1 hypothetical protein VD0003_g3014 [Verticillium dahliae]